MSKEKSEKIVVKSDLQLIRGALRQAFIRSEYRKRFAESITLSEPKYNKDGSRSKRDRKYFICADCGGEFKVSEMRVDHIKPIGQYFDFDHTLGFIERLWCDFDNLQGLCDGCHNKKTAYERSLVKGYNKL